MAGWRCSSPGSVSNLKLWPAAAGPKQTGRADQKGQTITGGSGSAVLKIAYPAFSRLPKPAFSVSCASDGGVRIGVSHGVAPRAPHALTNPAVIRKSTALVSRSD